MSSAYRPFARLDIPHEWEKDTLSVRDGEGEYVVYRYLDDAHTEEELVFHVKLPEISEDSKDEYTCIFEEDAIRFVRIVRPVGRRDGP